MLIAFLGIQCYVESKRNISMSNDLNIEEFFYHAIIDDINLLRDQKNRVRIYVISHPNFLHEPLKTSPQV